MSSLQAKLDSAVTQRRELQDDFHAADTHAKDMVAEVEALQTKHAEQIQNLKFALSGADNRIEGLRKTANTAEDRAALLAAKVRSLETDLAVEGKRLQEVEAKAVTHREKLAEQPVGVESLQYESYASSRRSSISISSRAGDVFFGSAALNTLRPEDTVQRTELTEALASRELLEAALSELQDKHAKVRQQLEDLPSIEAELADKQTRLDLAVRLYGEKVEECEELRLDLDDVKSAYRDQIETLLSQSHNQIN